MGILNKHTNTAREGAHCLCQCVLYCVISRVYVLIPWYRVYELIYTTTRESRLCAFQLKLLYGILVTNKMWNVGAYSHRNAADFVVRIHNQYTVCFGIALR